MLPSSFASFAPRVAVGVWLVGIAFSLGAIAQEDPPQVRGLVTRVASADNFDVEGTQVHAGSETVFEAPSQGDDRKAWITTKPCAPYLGETVEVFGKAKGRDLKAEKILLHTPEQRTVSGLAIVEVATRDPGGAWLLEADGRLLKVSAALLQAGSSKGSAASAADLHANEWVEYHGVEGPDGVVRLDRVGFADNRVEKREAKLRDKNEFDAAAVTDEDKQSGFRAALVGTDFRRIPAYHDATLQARIDATGQRLVPAFQKNLADDDATRIAFRFQLVDQPKWHDAITLPSGIILVPRQIVERLADDAQLAAVLADNIATALEKQSYRLQGTFRTLVIADLAGGAAGLVIPGAGLVTEVVTTKKGRDAETNARQQSGRVALSLMQRAGYDLRQAPEAWWILASKDGKDRRAEPPARAQNQFRELGTTWRLRLENPRPANGSGLQASGR